MSQYEITKAIKTLKEMHNIVIATYNKLNELEKKLRQHGVI